MMHAALGFRAHTGWAAAVALAGPAASPRVLERRRLDLAESPDVESAQVFHIAAELSRAAAEKLIERARTVALRKARSGLEAACAELRGAGHQVVALGVVLGNGRVPGELEAILRSHPLIHTAEGDLYRGALVDAGAALGLRVMGVASKELYDLAAPVLGLDAGQLRRQLGELGREVGKPWAQDQKESALVAWLALAAAPARSRGPRAGSGRPGTQHRRRN